MLFYENSVAQHIISKKVRVSNQPNHAGYKIPLHEKDLRVNQLERLSIFIIHFTQSENVPKSFTQQFIHYHFWSDSKKQIKIST